MPKLAFACPDDLLLRFQPKVIVSQNVGVVIQKIDFSQVVCFRLLSYIVGAHPSRVSLEKNRGLLGLFV